MILGTNTFVPLISPRVEWRPLNWAHNKLFSTCRQTHNLHHRASILLVDVNSFIQNLSLELVNLSFFSMCRFVTGTRRRKRVRLTLHRTAGRTTDNCKCSGPFKCPLMCPEQANWWMETELAICHNWPCHLLRFSFALLFLFLFFFSSRTQMDRRKWKM